jgi:hypothetical protein
MPSSPTRTLTIALVTAIVSAVVAVPVTGAQPDSVVTQSRTGVGGAAMQADTWISAEAERLSGRALIVGCAGGAEDWAARLSRVGLTGPAGEYYGFSLVQRGEMHLSPYVCEGLRLGTSASTRRSHELQVAWSVNVLIHESVHLARFSADERVAEACARIALPRQLHRLYQVEYHSAQMRRLTSAAAWLRRTMPPAYQGGTCSAPGA